MGFSPEVFQRHLASAGYESKDSPLIQPADLFLTKGGDRVIDRLITFERGNKSYALRPEFTASAALMYANDPTLGVRRWQFAGSIFQEPTAGGGDFTHHQLGAELIGWHGVGADAEIIGLAYEAIQSQGVDEMELVIGHAGLTHALLSGFQIDAQIIQFLLNQRGLLAAGGLETARQHLKQFLLVNSFEGGSAIGPDEDAIATLMAITPRSTAFGGRTREEIAQRLVQKRRRGANPAAIEQALVFLSDWVKIEGEIDSTLRQIENHLNSQQAEAIVRQWHEVLTTLIEGYGVPKNRITLRPDLNRVWDYYTGVVFEIRTASGLPVGGGGRYDGLIRLLSDQGYDVPAIGFGLDVDALTKHYGTDRASLDQRHVSITGSSPKAASIARQLRQAGFIATIHNGEAQNPMVTIQADDFIFNGQTYNDTSALVDALKDGI